MPTLSGLVVREATLADAATIATIYSGYTTGTTVSFETEAVGPEEMAKRMAEVMERGHPWLVAELAGRIVGYAYATLFRPRPAYRHTAEVTIYLEPEAVGGGIGSELYKELFPRMRALGFHTAVAHISLPNEASVALHESFGFRQAAYLPEVGHKLGRWLDIGIWQAMLDGRG
jgi:phosphinothricin acetyltransferase